MAFVWTKATHKKEMKKHFGHIKRAPLGTQWCMERCPGQEHMGCSLPLIHSGPHVAHGLFGLGAVWSDVDEPPN